MHSAPVIEGYKILSKIGEGATSVVWQAHQLSLDRTVVIKVLSDKLSREHEDVKLFLAEAQTAAKLKHGGIVQVYDFGQIKNDGRYFFVMEYVSGYTVGEWARRRGRIKESDAIIIAHHVGEALKYAWEQVHIIHCDIKPDNLMVDSDGTLKVMDLGLARIVFSRSVPSSGLEDVLVMGTPNYMSPEQAVGSESLDCRTDIYALGMTLYHVLTGTLPYGEGDALDIMAKQVKEPLPDPQKINPDLSAEVAQLVSKMTAKNINERFQEWAEVLTATMLILHHQNVKSALGSSQSEEAGKSGHTQKIEKAETGNTTNLMEDFKPCPYCAEPIRKKAVYCRYCGKDLAKQPGQAKSPAHTSVKVHLKPVTIPVAEQTEDNKEKAKTTRRRFNLAGNLRMVVSALIIVFLIYYWYNKAVRGHDILLPLRTVITKQINSLRGKASEETEATEQIENIEQTDQIEQPEQPAEQNSSE